MELGSGVHSETIFAWAEAVSIKLEFMRYFDVDLADRNAPECVAGECNNCKRSNKDIR